jgi:hypothetical protein
MAKHETFWTPKRLIELRVLYRTMSAEQLVKHFSRTIHDIDQAAKYEQNLRRLKLRVTKEKINGKTVRITTFAAQWAEGSIEFRSQWSRSLVL